MTRIEGSQISSSGGIRIWARIRPSFSSAYPRLPVASSRPSVPLFCLSKPISVSAADRSSAVLVIGFPSLAHIFIRWELQIPSHRSSPEIFYNCHSRNTARFSSPERGRHRVSTGRTDQWREYQKYTPEFREEMPTLVVEGQRANRSWLATSGSANDRRAMEARSVSNRLRRRGRLEPEWPDGRHRPHKPRRAGRMIRRYIAWRNQMLIITSAATGNRQPGNVA